MLGSNAASTRRPVRTEARAAPAAGDPKTLLNEPVSTQQLYASENRSVSGFSRQFLEHAYMSYLSGNLKLSHLPLVIQFNVTRGLAQNAAILGLPMEAFLDDDAVSPFNKQGPRLEPGVSQVSAFPVSLHPTLLQGSTLHHPWIDIFPFPRMRDNYLRSITNNTITWDEDELCDDIHQCGTTSQDASFIIWGEPWDPRNWEASIAFLRKWMWLLEGCPEILRSTNYWRRKRGEKRIEIQDIIRVSKTLIDHRQAQES